MTKNFCDICDKEIKNKREDRFRITSESGYTTCVGRGTIAEIRVIVSVVELSKYQKSKELEVCNACAVKYTTQFLTP